MEKKTEAAIRRTVTGENAVKDLRRGVNAAAKAVADGDIETATDEFNRASRKFRSVLRSLSE